MQYILDADVTIQLVKSGILGKIKNPKSYLNILDTILHDQVMNNDHTIPFDYTKHLNVLEVTSEIVTETLVRLDEKSLGYHDWTLITYAKKHRMHILTTNDKRLYKTACREIPVVKRLLGLLNDLIEEKLIEKHDLLKGLEKLEQDPSIRIPNDLINQLKKKTT